MRLLFSIFRLLRRKYLFVIIIFVIVTIFVISWASLFDYIGDVSRQINNITNKLNVPNPFQKPHSKEARFLLTRILSNDLVPLHADSQTLINTKFILDREILPKDFGRLWVIHSVIDKDKISQIYFLLLSYGEWVEILHLPKTRNIEVLQKAAFNINRGRNFALEHAFKTEAEWVFLYDGCSFLPTESLQALSRMANKPNYYLFHYTPMVRLHYKAEFYHNSTYPEIFPYVSGLQECQIGISRYFYENKRKYSVFKFQKEVFFPESLTYGNQDKLGLMRYFDHSLSNHSISCKDAFVGYSIEKADSYKVDYELLTRCGYMIRLLYHPEEEAPINQDLSSFERGTQRYASMVEFTKALNRFVGKESHYLPQFKFSK